MGGTTSASDGSGARVPLASLGFDPRAWPRQRVDRERVAQFASLYQEGGIDALPPIEAVDDGSGPLLSDGVTRVHAALAADLSELRAEIVPVPEGEDPVTFAYLRAVRAATGGHKELTRAERAAGIRRLTQQTDLTDAVIADLFGVSRTTVWRHRSGSANETRAEDAGEQYYAKTAASDIAKRLFRGIEKVYEARGLGLWDALTGDHTGERLARVLGDAYGDEALERALRFRAWFDVAIEALAGGRGR